MRLACSKSTHKFLSQARLQVRSQLGFYLRSELVFKLLPHLKIHFSLKLSCHFRSELLPEFFPNLIHLVLVHCSVISVVSVVSPPDQVKIQQLVLYVIVRSVVGQLCNKVSVKVGNLLFSLSVELISVSEYGVVDSVAHILGVAALGAVGLGAVGAVDPILQGKY